MQTLNPKTIASAQSRSNNRPRPVEAEVNLADPAWRNLYKIGAVAALVSVAFIPIAVIVFMSSRPPGFEPASNNVVGWFTLFQKHKLVALFDLDLVMIADNVLFVPLFLALYIALRRVSASLTAIAVVLGLVGAASYFAVNPAFSMLALSGHYAAATTDAERSAAVAAGETMLAIYQGTGFVMYILLVSAAGLIMSAAMLRSASFGKVTAYSGIVSNVLNPGMFLPTIGLLIGFAALLPLVVWYVLVARTLWRLGAARAD